MEFSKDSEIITNLENSLKLLNENMNYINIEFNNDQNWTENDFNNFTISLSNLDYEEIIENEILEVSNDNNNIFIVKNMNNIIKYCNYETTTNIDSKWINRKSLYNNNIENLFDYNININVVEENEFYEEPENWDLIKKKYILSKEIKYINKKKNMEYLIKMIKKDNNDNIYDSLKSSNILKNNHQYIFSIIIKENIDINILLEEIINTIKYISLNNIIMFKNDQNDILEQYNNLVKNDIKINNYHKKKFIPLLTPKPITLEKINLIDPKEFGAVSILESYTVTEKADGERLLLYINEKGKIYTINNTYNIVNTGLIAESNLFNSLIDGEYIECNKRIDNNNKNLFAAFDMYYIKGRNITNLPLMSQTKEGNSRYNYLKFAEKYINQKKSNIQFIVKTFYYNDDKYNILHYCNHILSNYKSFPYEIDGLIFTPSNLALFSIYSNKTVQLTDNVRWDRLFKWKPPEQNTIDFLIKFGNIIKEKGQKYQEVKLYIGYNSNQWEDIGPNKGLKLRYDYKYAKEQRNNMILYKPALFKPNIFYEYGVETAYIKINSKGEIKTMENQIIENNQIIEFSYDLNNKISINHRWNPLRVREDKTRLFLSGEISKTMNDLSTAVNVWRSIHNSVTNQMIMGNELINIENTIDKSLESDDIYYSRNIPRESLLSINMLNFHNQCIKKKLYEFSKDRSSLLELCGGEGGDMNRWIDFEYSFILSIDFVRQNIYNPKSGGYSRLLKKKNQHKRIHKDKFYFPDIVFAVGDCSLPINNGEAAKDLDQESEHILKIVMNKHRNNEHHLKYIVGKGSNKFSVCSCQFAIHYFFQNEEKLNGFFNNVSSNLKLNGIFFATFMDGNIINNEFNSQNSNIIKGSKILNDNEIINTWAILKKYDNFDNDINENKYGKQIGVYIENTQKIIPEYLVDLDLLINKAKEFNLELIETNSFEKDFNDIIKNIDISDYENLSVLEKNIIDLDKDTTQKKFSFFNRYVIFKKI